MDERSRSPEARAISPQDRADLMALDAQINALLPPEYQNCYDAVSPSSMGSAGLKFSPDGRVAWDEMWTSFCDLALAGGPAHRGKLLEAVPAEESLAEPALYQAVVEEIARGIWLTTELPALPRIAPAWVGVRCDDEAMAAWMMQAIVVENVTARRVREFLYLPAGPHFRLAKEIKNVVTAVAKTHHYWAYHMPAGQRRTTAPVLVEPLSPEDTRAEPQKYQAVVEELERELARVTCLPPVRSAAPGWVGVRCAAEAMSVWLMRALVVENVLARREGDVLYVPGAETGKVIAAVAKAWRLWGVYAATRPPTL